MTTKGEVRMKNIFGRLVSRDDIQGTLLPATTRQFNLELPTSLPVGIYKVEGFVQYDSKTSQLPSRWIILLPPFFLITAIIGVVALLAWIMTRRNEPKK
jgi:hypothetical protein